MNQARGNDPDVFTRLDLLGLKPTVLEAAVEAGMGAAFACTGYNPPNAAGFYAWSEGVRMLRERLCPLGWKAVNEGNYATVESPDGTMAIAVAAGDAATGTTATPATRSTKGPVTRTKIASNQLSFADIAEGFPPAREQSNVQRTWLLLHYFDDDAHEIRLELSLPERLEAGRVTKWRERIVLAPVPFTRTVEASTEEPSDELDVPVRRREVHE
jgi:hypothetical protein